MIEEQQVINGKMVTVYKPTRPLILNNDGAGPNGNTGFPIRAVDEIYTQRGLSPVSKGENRVTKLIVGSLSDPWNANGGRNRNPHFRFRGDLKDALQKGFYIENGEVIPIPATPGTGVFMITGTVDVRGSVHESHGAGGALQLNLSYVQLKDAAKKGLDLDAAFKNTFDGKMNHITMQDKKHQAFIAAGTQKLSGKVLVTFSNGDYTIRQSVVVPPVYVNILDMPPLVWSDRQRPYTPQPGRKKRVYPRSAQIGGLTFEEQALADLQERIPADCVLRKYVDDDAEAVGYDADYYNPVLDQIVHAYEITKSQVKNLPPNQWTKAKECVETGIHPYTLLTPSGPYLFNQETLDKWEEVIVIHRKVRTRVA